MAGAANVGIDCQTALDGVGYWLVDGSYSVHQPRLRRAVVTLGAVKERYLDAGPGARVWRLTVAALDGLKRFDGAPTGARGADYRAALQTSYALRGPVSFVDPAGSLWSVYIDDLTETPADLRATALGLGAGWLLAVTLVEASVQ